MGMRIGLRHGHEVAVERPGVVNTGAILDPAGDYPFGVWLQSASNATAYATIGINVYVGFNDANTAGFNSLKAAGIGAYVADHDQSAGLAYNDATVVIGWLQPDEPDDAKNTTTPPCTGDCPCIDPTVVQANYNALRNADPLKRPVYLNVGRCLGNPSNPDRGSLCSGASRNPGDYPKYFLGCDVASDDIYPVNNNSSVMTYVADAVDRLKTYAPGKPHYQIVECTKIESTQGQPTTTQTIHEVWLAIIHGADGIVYFCHKITPTFVEAGLLQDTSMKNAVNTLNTRVSNVALAIQSASISGGTVGSATRVDFCVKQYGNATYLFATTPNGSATVTFTLPPSLGIGNVTAHVLNESRNVTVSNGIFSDFFNQYDVHLYQIY